MGIWLTRASSSRAGDTRTSTDCSSGLDRFELNQADSAAYFKRDDTKAAGKVIAIECSESQAAQFGIVSQRFEEVPIVTEPCDHTVMIVRSVAIDGGPSDAGLDINSGPIIGPGILN